VWSVQFTNAGMLWLAAAAVLPVLIHLLARRKPQLIRFPAVQFLLKKGKWGSRKSSINYLLLMLLRMATIVLLALAVARPTLARRLGRAAEKEGTEGVEATVLILDDSMSMSYQRGEASWFERAQEQALQVLGGLRTGTELSICTTSRPMSRLTFNWDVVRSRLKGLRPSNGASSCWRALEAAGELLRNKAAGRVVLFTDMTRSAWQGLERHSVDMGEHVSVEIVDVSDPGAYNIAVTGLRSVGERRFEGALMELEADLLAVGKDAEETVEVTYDGETIQRRQVRLGAGVPETFLFRLPVKRSGHHWGTVAFPSSDPLPQDNARTFAFDARAAISVLCVEEQRTGARGAGSYFFRTALAPWREAERGMFRVTSVSPRWLTETAFGHHDVVVLFDVPGLDTSAWQRLRDFVAGGGGLLVFLGPQADPEAYAAAEARALMPARPADVVSAPLGQPFKLRLVDPGNAVLQGVVKSGADLSEPHFRYCRRLTIEPVGSEVLGLGPGLPALVLSQGAAGGQVAVFACPCDGSWSNFPRCPVFVPFCHELTLWLSGESEGALAEFRPGEHVPLRFEVSRWPTGVAVKPPGASDFEEVMVGTTPGRRVFWKTSLPGYYEVLFSRKDRTWRSGFAVNTAPIESDLRSVGAEEVKGALKAGRVVIFSGQDFWRPRSAGRLSATGWQRREVAPFLVLLALVVCVAELLVSNRFYRSP